jgi:ribosomal protein S18 acetylase RimI-like enzyme
VRVRPLDPADVLEVARIDAIHTGVRKVAYWKDVFRAFVGEGDARQRVGLAAEGPAGLCAYVLGEVRAFEFGSPPCGWIFAVGVDPQVSRRGIGSLLLRRACERFRELGVTKVRTMVRRNDVPVLAFFRTSGFAGGSYVQLEVDVDQDLPHDLPALDATASIRREP